MKKDTVIFDLDGTLLNTLEDLCDSANHALSFWGLPKRSLKEIRKFIGNGIRNLMLRCVYEPYEDGSVIPGESSVSMADFEKILKEFQNYYDENSSNKTRPYEGVSELLCELSKNGYKLAIVSNKHDSAVKELSRFYFGDSVAVAIGASDDREKKPAPDSVYEALRLLKSDNLHSVYVGDSEVDIKTAANAGMDCISCLWGYRDIDVLKNAGAKIFAEKPLDIISIVMTGWKMADNVSEDTKL